MPIRPAAIPDVMQPVAILESQSRTMKPPCCCMMIATSAWLKERRWKIGRAPYCSIAEGIFAPLDRAVKTSGSVDAICLQAARPRLRRLLQTLEGFCPRSYP